MEQKEMSKAYAVDFDGTLCENRWPEIGERRKKEFSEEDVYACDETSRVIAVGKEHEDGLRSLRLYLYLSEEDYAQYTKDRFDLD